MISKTFNYRILGLLKRKVLISLPSTWDDLTEEQFLQAISFRKGILNQGKAVKIFARVNPRHFPKKIAYLIIRHTLDNLKWLMSDEGQINHLIINNVAGLSAVYIEDLSFHSYVKARDHLKNGDNEMLCGFLYRDKIMFSGADNRSIQEQFMMFIDESYDTMCAVRLNFDLINNWLFSQYPYMAMAVKLGRGKKPSFLTLFDHEPLCDRPLLEVLQELNQDLKRRVTEEIGKDFRELKTLN